MQVYPSPAPDHVSEAWGAALDDAGIERRDAALLWREGKPRPTGQQAASWRAGSTIDPEFEDDFEFIQMLSWANGDGIRPLRRVMIWSNRTAEGLAGLLRHELEHTIQMAENTELDHLHSRAVEELTKRGATAKVYNAIPMEVDANRAAARFLRRRYGSERLNELVTAGDPDAACFRPTKDPEALDTLLSRMQTFILNVMNDDEFVACLEEAPPAS